MLAARRARGVQAGQPYPRDAWHDSSVGLKLSKTRWPPFRTAARPTTEPCTFFWYGASELPRFVSSCAACRAAHMLSQTGLAADLTAPDSVFQVVEPSPRLATCQLSGLMDGLRGLTSACVLANGSAERRVITWPALSLLHAQRAHRVLRRQCTRRARENPASLKVSGGTAPHGGPILHVLSVTGPAWCSTLLAAALPFAQRVCTVAARYF